MFLVIYVPKTQSVEVRQLGSSNRVPGEWHEDLEVGSDSAGPLVSGRAGLAGGRTRRLIAQLI